MKFFICFILSLFPNYLIGQTSVIKISDDLELIPLSKNVLIHKSFTDSEKFGRFSSNGVIYIQNGEAIIADTPVDTSITRQLVNWLFEQKIKISAVVVNHHHHDALGGLSVFNNLKIPSYGYIKTKELAEEDKLVPPSDTFDQYLKLELGNSYIEARFFGEGHTEDNITFWIPDEKILFGGCLIKSLKSGKGNLEDANTEEWANTVSKIKRYFPNAETVVPGHGSHGGTELLDFTIRMFDN